MVQKYGVAFLIMAKPVIGWGGAPPWRDSLTNMSQQKKHINVILFKILNVG